MGAGISGGHGIYKYGNRFPLVPLSGTGGHAIHRELLVGVIVNLSTSGNQFTLRVRR